MENVEDFDDIQNRNIRSKSVPAQLYKRTSESSADIDEMEGQLADVRESFVSNEFIDEELTSGELSGNTQTRFSLSTEEMETSNSMDKSDSMTTSVNSVQEVMKLSKTSGGNVPSMLPPLNEPLPDDWVTLEEDYVTICASYQTHLGSDVIMAPDARFSDGIIHLCIVRAGVQKTELIQLMSMLEKGSHIDHPSPNVELVKVLAFRLEPKSDEGIIMVDGEKVDTTSLQAQVLPGLAKLMAIQ